VVGTYSSVFTATPLLIVLNRRWPMPRSKPVRAVRDDSREDSGAVV
jgi:SecD/SecF fusion protein